MAITVDEISFNWDDQTATGDAMNIRVNYNTPVTVPEYVRNGRNEPSAYAASSVGNNAVSIRAQFSGGDANSDVMISAQGDSALGNVAATQVHFAADGTSGVVTMNLENGTIGTATLSAFNTTFTWTAGGGNIGTTTHRNFIVPDLPVQPWVQTAGNSSLPWSDALERLCTWAGGAAGAAIITALTREVNGCGATYDAGTRFIARVNPNWVLNLTGVLTALAALPNGFHLNCTECAATVTTFGRLAGVAYSSGEIRPTTGNPRRLVTTPIQGLGTANWQSWSWVFHEVAWNQYQDTGNVWDASCSLNEHAAFIAANLAYDGNGGYKETLVQSGDPNLPSTDLYLIR